MPRLIWLNGPPGVGKSTIARRYATDHPLTLVLDIDAIRDLLGDWPNQPESAGRAARVLALVMARAHLESGRDVVIPQLLARPEFPAELEALANATDVRLVEVVLTIDVETGERRFLARGSVSQLQWQSDSYHGFRDRLQAFLENRPAAIVVEAGGDIDGTYAEVLAAIG